MEPDIDGGVAYYRHANQCSACGRAIYSHEEVAGMIGISRRQFYRWLAGSSDVSDRLRAKIVNWLVANTPLPVRHG